MYPRIFLTSSFYIPTYALLVSLAIVTAVVLAYFECRRYGLPMHLFPPGAFWTVLGGMIGGKIFEIIFFEWDYFLRDPLGTLTSGGGWMYYGAEIGGAVGLLVFLAASRIDVFRPIDIAGIVLLISHAIGRLGCFLAGCCYGIPTESWAGMMFPQTVCAVHPTQLYESIPLALAFFIFWINRRRFVIPGSVYAAYLLFYSPLRFAIEFYRDDAYTYGVLHLSPSQYIALAAFMIGLWLLWFARRSHLQHQTA
ncbi:MAG: prolipoprotein diacylglyceryl transferase [Acidobacteriota bacterium]